MKLLQLESVIYRVSHDIIVSFSFTKLHSRVVIGDVWHKSCRQNNKIYLIKNKKGRADIRSIVFFFQILIKKKKVLISGIKIIYKIINNIF